MNPVRERLVIKLPAWSASTYSRIVKPRPRGDVAVSAIFSVACVYTECKQSSSLKHDLSKSGTVGSKTISALCLLLKYANR